MGKAAFFNAMDSEDGKKPPTPVKKNYLQINKNMNKEVS